MYFQNELTKPCQIKCHQLAVALYTHHAQCEIEGHFMQLPVEMQRAASEPGGRLGQRTLGDLELTVSRRHRA